MIGNRNIARWIGNSVTRGAQGVCAYLSFIILCLLFIFTAVPANAQVIGGHVYGGGNQGNVKGKTTVHVVAGDIDRVFGGARMANVGGRSYVHIDGANEATDSTILINQVYGGNDIAGNIGTSADPLPAELDSAAANGVTTEWNTLVRVSSKNTHSDVVTDGKKTTENAVFIGSLYAGGNGAFDYVAPDEEDSRHRIYEGETLIAFNETGFDRPEVDKTYLEVAGGSIGNAFGGGNNATIREKTVIHVQNESAVVNEVFYKDYDKLSAERVEKMGFNTGFTDVSAPEFQVGMFFGGNNRATMNIRPTWNLQEGKIRNLYSGGNRGSMTCHEGLLLDINPTVANAPNLIIDNIFGGCRMANVEPMVDGVYAPTTNLPGYSFPDEMSARVVVRRGNINNVYGGNDISGTVYGGSAVGIRCSVRGNVYGGGNGAYAYTDAEGRETDPVYGDFWYEQGEYETSVDALNAFRPNAEQVSIRLVGTEDHPTIIHGSVFVGGNCATISSKKANPKVELKMGSYVICDKVFLGNNGEKMVDPDILAKYADKTFSSLYLTGVDEFAKYMEGAAMPLQPSFIFSEEKNGDDQTYIDESSWVGSFFCGGNVGSMAVPGKNTYRFDRRLVIFEKLVGGCNNSYVAARDGLNATYWGGVLGSPEERPDYTDGAGNIQDRLEINFYNLSIKPKRWNDIFTQVTPGDPLIAGKEYYTTDMRHTKFIADGTEDSAEDTYYELTTLGTELEWNTAKWDLDEDEYVQFHSDAEDTEDERRLIDGNIYGGCYNSGHVNGNIIINLNEDVIDVDDVFDPANANVDFLAQRDDVNTLAMTVFGGGHGADTDVWGSTTVNHNNGYCFQIFGGGDKGLIGKKNINIDGTPEKDGNKYVYSYNPAYSTTVNLQGQATANDNESPVEDLAETEYIYAGGSEGDVCGNTLVNLGNGRIYDAFAGASIADILGHTEAYIGRQPDGNGGYKLAFPWIRDNVYGGNDFGGTIHGSKDFSSETTRVASVEDISLLTASTFIKYIQGRVDTIVGGNYGGYDYKDREYSNYTDAAGNPINGFGFPYLRDNSFVLFQPVNNSKNSVSNIFGSSEGYAGDYKLNNSMQTEAYVLIDDTESSDENRFVNMDVYGGGSYSGVGKYDYFGAGRTIVDLFAGRVGDVYGGCNREGLVGYSRVNVPTESTIKVNAIFGGGKGYSEAEIEDDGKLAMRLCDHYVTCVNYKGANAIVDDAIYGGNQNCRIACDTYLNIEAPVMQSNGYQATVYGGGYGGKTVSGRTNIFMNNGSNAYNVFGGGRDGNVFNYASLAKWMADIYVNKGGLSLTEVENVRLPVYRSILESFGTYLAANPFALPAKTGTYPNSSGVYDGTYTNDILPDAEDTYMRTSYHQTNVHIMQGGNVSGYAYGGGYGSEAIVGGTTYIELKGGNVDKDIYGGGQGGHVYDEFNLGSDVFTATTNVNIEGGMCRNAYGGGYQGHVGYHVGDLSTNPSADRHAVANVIIGKKNATSFTDGIPAVMRNVYGGGEGGSVYGTTNVTVYNGYIGYRHKNIGTEPAPVYKYVEELDDQKPNALDYSGNVFGGGYVINSYVDITNIDMYGGTVRGSIYGGGEVGPIGRGTVQDISSYESAEYKGIVNGNARIFKAGQTHVRMYNGHVLRNVFGGGRGKDSWGGDGTMYMDKDLVASLDMKVKGFVFGQTDVNIYGGEIGTDEGMARSFGNVFGGCDEGVVYSAYEQNNALFIGNKPTGSVRYDKGEEGYYYRYNGTKYVNPSGTALEVGDEKFLTEDCHVLIEPWLQTKAPINYNAKLYAVGDYIPTSYLNTLPKKEKEDTSWPVEWDYVDAGSVVDGDFVERGIIIHNAVFAGGNIAYGSDGMYANTKTVFGNATATIHDVYNRDLITIGTGHTGGLYGDGNLTLVDGYRELNVTNYGTDYFNIKEQIDYADYLELPPREQAYYELKYRCIAADGCTDNEGTHYTYGTSIPRDELVVLFEGNTEVLKPDGTPNPLYWTENGVVSRYAGRILNTIQRADFCGVFGSRMVMRGAKDRVPEVADNTNYTINRVREVSLNLKRTTRSGDLATTTNEDGDIVYAKPNAAEHGNYFGIYSVVNHLGALTSDVDFQNSIRYTDNTDNKYKEDANSKAYKTATFADWKKEWHKDPRRNNGLSHNELALASGVYLELTTEEGTGRTVDTKEWGIITGVVQLDLINVAKGVGGGFVYAKNIHGVRQTTGKKNTLLSDLNRTGGVEDTCAVTNKVWKYIETDAGASATQEEWQTSGNFVHNTLVIIDDCYNVSGKYLMGNRVPAHYWYIRGSVYVYDQYITAHTGSPSAYSKSVELPITISAAARNKMTLMDVQPNLYAYYSNYSTGSSTGTKLSDEQKVVINDDEYYLNTPISYWDWSLLPASERNLFVEETYVTSAVCEIKNGVNKDTIQAGYVMLPSEYTTLRNNAELVDITPDDEDDTKVKAVKKMVKDEEGNYVVAKDSKDRPIYLPFESVFHSSNELSHETGYMLTYKMTNPGLWDTWYTKSESATHDKQQNTASGYIYGPTYYLDSSKLGGASGMLLGQTEYAKGAVIPENIYTSYGKISPDHIPNNDLEEGDEGYDASRKQATFERAYVITEECSSATRHYYAGAPVSKTEGTSSVDVKAEPAYVCTGTIQLGPTDYIFINDLMTETQKNTYMSTYSSVADDIDALVVPAYYCTDDGLYGGNYYTTNTNYRALDAYSSMSEDDRKYFLFNYDALDLLIDPNYESPKTGNKSEGHKYQYDSYEATPEKAEINLTEYYKAGDPEVDGEPGSPVADDVKKQGGYSVPTPIDYKAAFAGSTSETSRKLGMSVNVIHARATESEPVSTELVSTIVVGDTLLREDYERLPNEQYHYAPIDVTAENKTNKFYIVKEAFFYKEPFAAGQIIDRETVYGLPASNTPGELNLRNNVDSLDLHDKNNGTYYYCRDSYKIDSTAVQSIAGTDYSVGSTVPIGTLLSESEYGKLVNYQKNFNIFGESPMETSTLYVSRNADYDNLTKEKIITVVYQYDYEESDEDGKHINPISERHVVRIHITFENGVPIVEDIQEPDIVLPGTGVTMRVPGVTSNGYEVIGGGWELFETPEDAESHFSGKEYTPTSEPLYWYQDEFYLAYYAKTYNRGKTYSNSVPVHVANYHDLKEVMDDKTNHLHVDYDRTRLKRDAKIYINDYSGSSQNGLDLFKSLYDLSMLPKPDPSALDEEGLYKSGDFEGHKPFNVNTATGTNIYDEQTYERGVKGGNNLEFFFRTDIERPCSAEDHWTPIGNDGEGNCFRGTVHGDGHTVSGLDNSLFNNLCGDVYNLGVTGSFTSAGVVDQGSGYVESCWTNTTGTPSDDVYAVFGNPSRTTDEIAAKGSVQLVNSYYQEEKTYKTTAAAHGVATAKNAKAFYDGEVAYDLNSFYLNKRYYQGTNQSTGKEYKYWTLNDDDTRADETSTGFYPASGYAAYGDLGYVEDRFKDGDFRYAAGEIPTSEDERYDAEDTKKFYPIWPDDYIFFGQKLTYGYNAHSHQNTPSAVARFEGRLSPNSDANRVYRAPAYYGSKVMGVAHFNPTAYLAQYEKLTDEQIEAHVSPREAYPNMTAIDFAGHNNANEVNGAYALGQAAAAGGIPALYYPPLLDDDGLISIQNCDETQNLLAYAPAASGESGYVNAKTDSVLTSYFADPVYNDHYDNSDGYRIVSEFADNIPGHLVQSNLVSINDHLLVDKQDFNCPIAYSFDKDHLMWHQRRPSNSDFVDHNNGWQGISLPFTAELVTTHQKGEITHFYSKSENAANSDKKIGHEYWLREFNDINIPEGEAKAKADFLYPTAIADGDTKEVTNRFLWDYYYKNEPVHDQKDANEDIYLEYKQYYNDTRRYEEYPMMAAATPYILGLPGETYYEFDLSGIWMAKNTAAAISQLEKQIITFASEKQTTIGVSDDEMAGKTVTYNGMDYIFKPSYMNKTLATGNYVLNSDGNAYVALVADAATNTSNGVTTAQNAFRPYFVATAHVGGSGSGKHMLPERIVFGGNNGELYEEGPETELNGGIEISTRGRAIIVKSNMKVDTTIRIVNVAGVTVTSYVLEPGKTVETPVNAHGTYVVNRKKIFVQ